MSSITPRARARLLVFWLVASSFGIMFAVLSWMQEAGILPPADELGAWKGLFAVLSGLGLYLVVARHIPGGPADR
jgi:hypothetical protein